MRHRHLMIISLFIVAKDKRQTALAKTLEVDASKISKIGKETAHFTEEELQELLAAMQKKYNFLKRDDFNLNPKDFIDMLSLGATDKLALYEKLGLDKKPTFYRADLVDSLYGKYFALYLCGVPGDNHTRENGVAVDFFEIRKGLENGIANITQIGHSLNVAQPEGTVVVKKNTVEIDIDYPSQNYVRAKYLSPLPAGEIITSFFAVSLDVKIVSLDVVARPVLFIKISNVPSKGFVASAGTRLFETAKAFMDRHVVFNGNRFEITPGPYKTEDILEIRQAFNEMTAQS